jgi:hypothetical protein
VAFHLRHTAGDGNDNFEAVQGPPNVRFPEKALQHATKKPVIADHPGANRPRSLKFSWCPPASGFRLSAHRLDSTRAGSDRYDRRLIHSNSATLDV